MNEIDKFLRNAKNCCRNNLEYLKLVLQDLDYNENEVEALIITDKVLSLRKKRMGKIKDYQSKDGRDYPIIETININIQNNTLYYRKKTTVNTPRFKSFFQKFLNPYLNREKFTKTVSITLENKRQSACYYRNERSTLTYFPKLHSKASFNTLDNTITEHYQNNEIVKKDITTIIEENNPNLHKKQAQYEKTTIEPFYAQFVAVHRLKGIRVNNNHDYAEETQYYENLDLSNRKFDLGERMYMDNQGLCHILKRKGN